MRPAPDRPLTRPQRHIPTLIALTPPLNLLSVPEGRGSDLRCDQTALPKECALVEFTELDDELKGAEDEVATQARGEGEIS